MARTFYNSTTASDLSSGGSFSNAMIDSQQAAGSITLTAAQGGGTDQGSYFTASGVPGTDGTSTGTFTLRTNITFSNNGVNFRANLMRINSAGTVQATVNGSYLAAAAGTRTQTFTNPALGTWAAGDRLRVQYQIQNTNAHGGDKGITFETGQLAQDTPFAAAANPITATPSTASLTTATFAPTVTASDHKTVTPGVASLTTSTLAPTVTASDNQTATPGLVALTTATFAPTVSATANLTVTPAQAELTAAGLAPTVSATAHQTVTPDTVSLSLTGLEPTVTGGAGLTVTPGTASLTTATFVPTVSATDHQVVTPALAEVTLATFAPTVTANAGTTVTPDAASLSLSTFAPTLSVTEHRIVIPAPASLTLAGLAPTVTGSGGTPAGGLVTKRRTFRPQTPVVVPPVIKADETEDYFALLL